MKALLTPRTAAVLALILLLGGSLRLAVILHAPVFIIDGDSRDFFVPGYQLVQDGTFPLRLKRAPLYPLFLAANVAVFGPALEPVVMVQHVLGLATVVLVYFLGSMVFGRIAGLLAAVGTAINGPLLLMEHTIESEAIFAPLLAAGLLLLLLAVRSGRLALFLLAGFTMGLGALARPLTQAVVPLALAAILIQPRSWSSRLRGAGLVCLAFLLTTGPWIARNQVVHGVPGISGGVGEALYERVRLHDSGFTFHDLAEPTRDEQRARIRRRVFELGQITDQGSEARNILRQELRLSEAQADAALQEASLQVVKQEPDRYIWGTAASALRLGQRLDGGSLYRFWETPAPIDGAWPQPLRRALERSAARTPEDRWVVENVTGLYRDSRFGGLIAVPFLLGSIRCLARPRGTGSWLLPAVVVSQLLLYVALSGPLSRFRQPFQPLITLLAAGGLSLFLAQVYSLWSHLRRHGLPGGGLSLSRRGPAPAREEG